MRENKFHKWIKKEIETEASGLERQAEESENLSSPEMPEDSYTDLMKRIEAGNAPAPKAFHIRKRTLLAVALAAILIAAVGAGASGSRLFSPRVEESAVPGEFNVQIITGDEVYYFEMAEDEAYEEIEEQLGILALRLGYKPQGMNLEKVYIDAEMGEAQMEFVYDEHIMMIYENKQYSEAIFNLQPDGEVIDSTETFYVQKKVDIVQIDKGDGTIFYAVQFEQGNAYYYVTSDMDLDEFKEIIYGIIFESV